MDALVRGINQLSHYKDLPIPDALPLSQTGLTQVDYKMDPIVSNLRDTLVEKISGDRLKKYWKRRGRFKISFAPDWIDWKVMKKNNERIILTNTVIYCKMCLPADSSWRGNVEKSSKAKLWI